jgi:hypothetical protein
MGRDFLEKHSVRMREHPLLRLGRRLRLRQHSGHDQEVHPKVHHVPFPQVTSKIRRTKFRIIIINQ